MSFPVRISLALAPIFLAHAPLRAADTIEIKPRWLAGKKYYQTMRTDQESKAEIGEEKMEQKMITTIEATETVQNGLPKRMTMRYERVNVEMDVNGQKMTYDSANPGASTDPLGFGKTYGALVGQDLKVSLDGNDEIVHIENYDDFIKRFAAVGEPSLEPEKMFSRELLTQMMKQGGLQSEPGKPVTIGDAWPFHNTIELPEVGKITVNGTYTLKSIGDHNGARCAEITADGTLSMDVEAAAPDSSREVKVTGGTVKGPIWFDLQLGTERESQLVEEMVVSMKDPDDPTATVVMPSKTKVTTTLTKFEDAK